MAQREPIIDKEFRDLLDPPTPEEKKRLKEKLAAEGQTEDLIGWDEAGVLVDGHTRYAILTGLGQVPRIDWRPFGPADDPKSRDAVIEWIVTNQLGRRNLGDRRYDYFVGKKYLKELEKARGKKGGGDTAAKVAKETGKSEKTVRRAAAKAKAIDEVAKTDPEKAARMKAGKERVPKPAPKKKAGKARFDHKKFDAAFGVVARGPDDLMDAYPEAPVAAKSSARMLNQKLNELRKAWEQLVKVTAGS